MVPICVLAFISCMDFRMSLPATTPNVAVIFHKQARNQHANVNNVPSIV